MLKRSSTIPLARGITRSSCIGPPSSRRPKSGLPAASTTGTTVTPTSSSSPSSANCEATLPPPTTQSLRSPADATMSSNSSATEPRTKRTSTRRLPRRCSRPGWSLRSRRRSHPAKEARSRPGGLASARQPAEDEPDDEGRACGHRQRVVLRGGRGLAGEQLVLLIGRALLGLLSLGPGLSLDVGLRGHRRCGVSQLTAGPLDVGADLLRRAALVGVRVYFLAACARCFVHCTSSFVLAIACSGAGGVAS